MEPSTILSDIIYHLNPYAWENKVGQQKINEWLKNFTDEDHALALFLLYRFLYFGEDQVRQLLRALYKDQFRGCVIRRIRARENNTTDTGALSQMFLAELRATRFVGMGKSSESAGLLLYFFRTENDLPLELIVESDKVLPSAVGVSRYVFIDDLAASGEQATEYSREVLRRFPASSDVAFWYMPVAATQSAKEKILSETRFSRVASVITLDETFVCFGSRSRYSSLAAKQEIAWSDAQRRLKRYEKKMNRKLKGFGGVDLLLGFFYNTPNNTLPIFWADSEQWTPIFPRYTKSYKL